MLRFDMQLQNLVDQLIDSLNENHNIYAKVKVISANDTNYQACYFCGTYTCSNCLELANNLGNINVATFISQTGGPQFTSNTQLYFHNFGQ